VKHDEVPIRQQRATVCWSGDGILNLIGYSEAEGMQMVTNNQAAITLKQRIQTSPESMRWAVNSFAVADGGAVIAETIRQGIAVAVCDGSFKDAFGTAAYVLEGATMEKRMVVVLVTPGKSSDQSPY
jgi:DNA mismatch repair ATPase MutS